MSLFKTSAETSLGLGVPQAAPTDSSPRSVGATPTRITSCVAQQALARESHIDVHYTVNMADLLKAAADEHSRAGDDRRGYALRMFVNARLWRQQHGSHL